MAFSLSASTSRLVASARTTQGMTRASRRPAVRAMASKVDFVKATVDSASVVVFSKTYCPYCTRAKQLLGQLGAQPKVLELDQMGAEGAAIQDSLRTVTGRGTVPQIFIGGSFIGGCDDTVALHGKGGLVPLLEKVGVKVAA